MRPTSESDRGWKTVEKKIKWWPFQTLKDFKKKNERRRISVWHEPSIWRSVWNEVSMLISSAMPTLKLNLYNHQVVWLCTKALSLIWWENFPLLKWLDSLLLLKHLRHFKQMENKRIVCQELTSSTAQSNSLTSQSERRDGWEDETEELFMQINPNDAGVIRKPFS